MIQKTPEEKEALKRAKAQFKQNIKTDKRLNQISEIIQKAIYRDPPILTGLLEKEKPLADDYPVYWDYYYVVAKNAVFNVVKSNIQGTVKDLRRDLEQHYKVKVGEIFSCDLKARNLL